MYKIQYHKKTLKEIEKLKAKKLDIKVKKLIDVLKNNPYQNPPPYEKLVGELNRYYCRRINFKHRLVYKIDEEQKVVSILSMWTHYENM